MRIIKCYNFVYYIFRYVSKTIGNMYSMTSQTLNYTISFKKSLYHSNKQYNHYC